MQEHDAGAITASRIREFGDQGNVAREYTDRENEARNELVLARLRMRYRVFTVKGAYIQSWNTPRAEEVAESVLFVVDLIDRLTLEKDLRKLGQEFNQDSVMFVPRGTDRAVLWGTKKDEFSDRYSWPRCGESVVLENAVWASEGEFIARMEGRPFVFRDEAVEIPPPDTFFGWLGLYAVSRRKDWRSLL
jgi:hypothetical protein